MGHAIYIHIALLILGATSPLSQKAIDRENKVKAEFLFNLAQFVEWPRAVLPESVSPLIIGILGDNPFGAYLEELVSGKNVNGHPLLVRYCQTAEEAKACHLVYINFTDRNKMKEALVALKGQSVLTVSDNNNFIGQGGMVKLIKRGDKTEIVINDIPTKECNLIVSSKLLAIARVVHKTIN